MKFSDIDFSAISNMMANMSDDEKEQLNQMAQNMMGNMQNAQESVEEDVDMYEFLGIDEEEYSDIPGTVLDQIESAVDLETYYEDIREADFSASILFYSKAVLTMLRKYHFPIYASVLECSDFKNPALVTLNQYLYPLMNVDTIHTLVDEGFGTPEDWMEHKNTLQQLYILLNRAEYDVISYEDVQVIKSNLFTQKGLLRIKELM